MRRYSTDLTDGEWRLISGFIPRAKRGGRPRSTCPRRTVDGILYLVRTGCQWRHLPIDFPPWRTVYGYFVAWQRKGVVRRIQRALYEKVRVTETRKLGPSAVVIDSQSVKTSKAGGLRGFDGGKRVKGRKRHVVVDTLGLMVDVSVTAANVHDTVGAKKVLTKAVKWLKAKPKVAFADKGYQGAKLATWAKKTVGLAIRTSNNPAMAAKRFIPMKKRWVVERTFAWFGDYRRLDKDHERQITHSTGMIRWAMVRLMLNRLC